MTELHEHSNAVETTLTLLERRRPGRMATVSPVLTPLLRGGTVPLPIYEEHRKNDLTPAIGIGVSVVISGLIWAALVWII